MSENWITSIPLPLATRIRYVPRALANIKLPPVRMRALDSIESIRFALLFVIVIDVPESST